MSDRPSAATRFAQKAARKLFPAAERLGVHLTPVHFYQPIPDTRSLTDEIFDRVSDLPGVDMNEASQLTLFDRLVAWRHEYETFPSGPTGSAHVFHLNNDNYDHLDARILHAMVRTLRPRRVLEIGSGWSSLITSAALAKNRDEGDPGSLESIEPYPRDLIRGLPGLDRLIEKGVEQVPLSEFESLEAGDILFIDSTHVLRIGGDVRYEYLEILPRLRPGVVVHIHDIFLPLEYPKRWALEKGWFWTEQYLLQAFLAFNTSFEVVLASNYLLHRHPERFAAAFPAWPADHRAGSFWLRRL